MVMVSKSNVLTEQCDRVGNLLLYEEDVGAMVQWITFMIWKVILSTGVAKCKRSSFDNFVPIKKRMIVALHQLSHMMTGIKGAGQDNSKQKIVVCTFFDPRIVDVTRTFERLVSKSG
jgi:hypothetical protein